VLCTAFAAHTGSVPCMDSAYFPGMFCNVHVDGLIPSVMAKLYVRSVFSNGRASDWVYYQVFVYLCMCEWLDGWMDGCLYGHLDAAHPSHNLFGSALVVYSTPYPEGYSGGWKR